MPTTNHQTQSGITLVALVITIIILLILAGIGISLITGGEGIFQKTDITAKEHKKASMIELVETAKTELFIDALIDGTEINLENLIGKIKETSEINEKDYIITDIEKDEVTGTETVTIIDKKTGVVIDIWMDINGNVRVEGTIVNDISKVTKPTITYTLDPAEGYAETVTIKITVTEEKNGVASVQLPDNTVKTYNNEKTVEIDYPVNENGTYPITAVGGNGRSTTKYIQVKNAMSAADIEITNLNEGIASKDTVPVKIKYDENVRVGGKTLINEDRYQYKIGNGEVKTASSAEITITVEENGTVAAWYFDGTDKYKTSTLTINNIDKEKPTVNSFNATEVTTYSIKVEASATDEGSEGTAEQYINVRGYKYRIDKGSWSEETEETSYTFNNLTQGTSHEIGVIAIDIAGNESEEKTITQSVTGVANSETQIGVDYNPKEIVQGPVTVTFEDNSDTSGLTLKYQIGSTDDNGWLEYPSEGVSVSENVTVYARLFDAENQSVGTATATVDNIDKEAPTIGEFTGGEITEGTTMTITATQVQDTGGSGLKGYYISTEPTTPTETNVTWISNTTDTISVSKEKGIYYIWVIDNVGNISTVKSCNVIQKVTSMTISETSKTLLPNQTFTVSATVLPETANNTNIIWSTSDSTVAAISETSTENGAGITIQTNEIGTATITATAADESGHSATCIITVKETLADIITPTNYGDSVEYSAGGVSDWKIFYNDGTNIFLISSNYVDFSTISSATSMSNYSGNSCSAYWPNNSMTKTGAANISTEISDKYLFRWLKSNSGSTHISIRAIAHLLDTNAWSNFVDSEYADSAIGGPTLDMWVNSWNAKGYTPLYYNNSTTAGYYCGTTSSPTTTSFSLESDADGTKDLLYFPNYNVWYGGCKAYWLAAPNAYGGEYGGSQLWYVRCNLHLDWDDPTEKDAAVRPVVMLNKNVRGAYNGQTWELSN